MKRVHGYTEEGGLDTAPPAPEIPPTIQAGKRPYTRKRKSSMTVEGAEAKKSKGSKTIPVDPGVAMLPPPNPKQQQLEELQAQWKERRDILEKRVKRLEGPGEATSYQEMRQDVDFLRKIAEKIRELG
jgi:hypothetical protein